MRRGLILLLLAVALVTTAGVARGDDTSLPAEPTIVLPSAQTPNGADLALPANWTWPPVQPAQLSYEQLLDLWTRAGQVYAVPWNVLAAINKIESNFGGNMGPSSAGAIGWMQFMPSTWLRWGTDADGDGVADPWNPADAIYSAARYLAASGAAADIRRAVFSYNHAWWYVDDVMELAQLYGSSGGAPVVEQPAQQQQIPLDQLQAQLAGARAAVATANEAYQAAQATALKLAEQELQAVAPEGESQALLSDRLEAQKLAAQRGKGAYAAQVEANRLRTALHAAEEAVTRLEKQVQSAPTDETAGLTLSAAPQQGSGTYVFPVGGGPSSVSVSHTHHDYPAADIAAPEGSPVYALSSGTVLYAWSRGERCGIGFTMQTADAQVWTYCHLSYVYPTITPGAALTAGSPVGLVGATGNATGPHLHLQLQPAASYPQEQGWFQSLAGTAFQWSDEVPTEAPAAGQTSAFPPAAEPSG